MDYGLRVNIAAAIAALLLVMPTLATAADLEIPKLDVEANCELAAELSYGSRSTKLTCLRQEQEAYNGLKAVKFRIKRIAVRASFSSLS